MPRKGSFGACNAKLCQSKCRLFLPPPPGTHPMRTRVETNKAQGDTSRSVQWIRVLRVRSIVFALWCLCTGGQIAGVSVPHTLKIVMRVLARHARKKYRCCLAYSRDTSLPNIGVGMVTKDGWVDIWEPCGGAPIHPRYTQTTLLGTHTRCTNKNTGVHTTRGVRQRFCIPCPPPPLSKLHKTTELMRSLRPL